ncbi:MAG TPA: hypothetical protein DEG17_04915 [Cyanobacteria bacterium UBA11149]|nr:hypothetical protein [Cyanobacteria bacterium UBA11367]HBE56457.1 hypothetical protein [Cyanobacteria bacterium UBA11366]HBR77094.1 hypothetical protein [Cyanobacteria bacterium UBA11159]HBS71209.1 hypothetical protein [Cyanobacteria bacterium UBA11153]HBW88228.1 hypothetical protein [Cyanobacteria bacterium UBA11149]HCA96789.1 hypothetical protein [Cyanobacteria bacterium UBA9226]
MESKVAKNTYNCRKLTIGDFGNCGLKRLLQQQIEAAIGLCGRSQLNPQTISIHRLSHHNSVIYRSAIALQLSPLWQLPPDDIAHQLMAAYLTISEDNLYTEVVSTGWIHFLLRDRSLAALLQNSIDIPPSPPTLSYHFCSTRDNLFPLQYSHARCSSLLRLGQVGAEVVVENFFLDGEGERLLFVDGAEWALIFHILDLLDVMDELDKGRFGKVIFSPSGNLSPQSPSHLPLPPQRGRWENFASFQGESELLEPSLMRGGVKLLKQGLALCQAFDRFHRSCRIWGEVQIDRPRLAEARLSLVRVTQILLRSLLEDYFGLPAPTEL